MNTPGAQDKIIESIRSSETILITVSQHPSVDELAAALGLTMYLNDIGKHATAVMSGDIPPAITFLKPEKTFKNSVDSLRDFVIALDKEKADHLRYKVEGDVVKIFITPYRTVITEKDFEYSQGDYNVETVLALGVTAQKDLDKALESHGKILHDATVATIGLSGSSLGSIDWHGDGVSSISEMVAQLVESLKGDGEIAERVASALLTGIVAATERFSNDKTSPVAMTAAAKLMSYGANQQLIAARLQDSAIIKPDDKPKPEDDKPEDKPTPNPPVKKPKTDDNNLTVEHDKGKDDLSEDGGQAKKDEPANLPKIEPKPEPKPESKPEPVLPLVAPSVPVMKTPADDLAFEATPVAPAMNDLASELAKEASQRAQPEPENELERLLNETKQVAKQTAESRLESSKLKLPLTPHAERDGDDPTLAQIDEKFRKPPQIIMPPAAPNGVDINASSLPNPNIPAAPPSGSSQPSSVSTPEPPTAPVPSLTIPDLPPLQVPAPNIPEPPAPSPASGVPNMPAQSTVPVPAPNIELPPLPPAPDFSQSPGLPPAPDFSQFLDGSNASGQANVGQTSTQPRPSVPPAAPSPSDPGQFKIPGQ